MTGGGGGEAGGGDGEGGGGKGNSNVGTRWVRQNALKLVKFHILCENCNFSF